MVDKIHSVIDLTRKRITRSYHIALLLAASIVLCIAGFTGYMVDEQRNEMTVVVTAGKQRMLAQRIAFLVNQLADTPEHERGDTLQKLNATVRAMELARTQLTVNQDIEGVAAPLSEDLRRMYFEPPVQLDMQMAQFLQHAHNIIDMNGRDLTDTHPEIVATNKQASGRLLDAQTVVIAQYLQEVIDRFNALKYWVYSLCLLAVLLLIGIALLVLKPAIAFVEQAQKRLLELNQLKGDFLANMSHEIRTPMNGILGMSELLLDSGLNTRQQHYARTLQNSADHLLGLINDILDFSKLEAGQMKLDPIRFNLLATIEDVLDLIASRAREKNLEVLMRYVPGTPRFVVADPGRIRQVLFNLIGNAIKFTDQGYVMVHVEMVPPKSAPDKRLWLRVRIEDTGIGIPEDKVARLFEKFMQVESGSTRAQQGTGLGLAICRNLVTLMGGNIHVESQPGKGTVFAWQIPLADASEPQPAVYPHETLNEKRVLLVDDLAPNRLLYKEALGGAGVTCLVAENAEEALSMLAYEISAGQRIDAVITDYMMPGGNGIRLTQAIKADEELASIPVIILSSAGEQGLIRRFDAAGASACLSKPATRQQLFDTLAHVITAAAEGQLSGIITGEVTASLSARRLLKSEQPLHGTHILLVEDNRVNLEITTEMLHQFGCDVTTAVNGHEAIHAVRGRAFDLIFMDCQMPEMDGFEAAEHIVAMKMAGQIAPVPIVALTANALKGDRERCLESGMDDYLSKPMRKASLEAILLKWLRARMEEQAQVTHEQLVAIERQDDEMRRNADTAHEHGVDFAAFSTAREMLGAKLTTILSYYLEDADGYLDRIAEAIALRDPAGAITPAHTLKSSSRQLGVNNLAELAEQAEAIARSLPKGSEMRTLEELLQPMRDALAQARPFFHTSNAA